VAREPQRHGETAILAHDITVDHDACCETSTNPAFPTASTFASAAAASIRRVGRGARYHPRSSRTPRPTQSVVAAVGSKRRYAAAVEI